MDQAIIKEGDRLARADDPIEVSPERFTVAGQTWSDPGQSVLHTVRDPDQPDRYVTIFHSNGQDGWQRLRLIWYYRKDTTVVWDKDQTVFRRVHEPDAWIPTVP